MRKRYGWKPRKKSTDCWIREVIQATFLNRPPGIYRAGAEQRIVESALDWYYLGRFTNDRKFIDFLEAEFKGEEI